MNIDQEKIKRIKQKEKNHYLLYEKNGISKQDAEMVWKFILNFQLDEEKITNEEYEQLNNK